MDQPPPKAKFKPPPLKDRTPLLEWLVSVASLALVASALGFIVWDGAQRTDDPPALEVRVLRVVATDDGYVAEIRASNRSRATAANVELEGALKAGGAEVEISSVTLDYVPGLGHQDAGLVFQADPRAFSWQPVVKGYAVP